MYSTNVALIYSDEIDKYSYGQSHNMKPKRISMAYDLILNYDIMDQFYVYVE